MTKLRLFGAAAALALGMACAPAEMSVHIQGASFLDNNCGVTNQGVNLIRGSLDIGPLIRLSRPIRYAGHFQLQSDLQSITTTVGDDVLASGARNDFIADTILSSYATQTAPGTPIVSSTSSIYFVVKPQTGGTPSTSFVQFNLITPDAAGPVSALVTAGGPEVVLLVSFQFEGRLRSAPETPPIRLRTNEVTFPISVRNVTPPTLTCPAGQAEGIAGPCGNSQDAFAWTCLAP